MNVGIVGAGIAGLGAAVALRRAGHDVEVFEKSNFKKEIGAAILLTPNGNRVLRRWGFDFEKARPVDFMQWRLLNANTLEKAASDSFEEVEAQFGERCCSYHRVDLHAGLRDLAEKYGAIIRLGAYIVDIEPEEGVVTMEGGGKVEKDFWVLADGCRTSFLPKITDESIPTVKIGKSVYRWLAPFDAVLSHPSAAAIWTNEGPGFCNFFNDNITIVTYPCRGGSLLNCALFHNTRPDERDKEDWNSSSSHDNVLELLEGCHEMVRRIPMTADDIKVYTVTQRPPSAKLSKGKMLCIGDTTHHMLPSHAQGGCQALEDAAALEVLLSTPSSISSLNTPTTATFIHTPSNFAKRMALFKALRLPRSATTQILSSTSPRLTMASIDSKTQEIRKFYKGDLLDWPLGVGSLSGPVREFFYGYDIFGEAERAVLWQDSLDRRDGDEVEQGEEVSDGRDLELELPQGWKWFGELSEESRMKKHFVEQVAGQ